MSKCKKQVSQLICDLKSTFGHPATTDRNLIFRGEPECYYAVESSLLREIKNSLKTICGSDWESVPENIFDESYFNRSMGMEVAPYVGGGIVRDLEFEAIATLQHYGAPTTLIDFSRDWRVALFFACEKLADKSGRIIYFSCSEAKKHYNLEVKSPKGHSHDNTGQEAGRQVEQQSVLVSSQDGKFKPKSCHIEHKEHRERPLARQGWTRHKLAATRRGRTPPSSPHTNRARWWTQGIYERRRGTREVGRLRSGSRARRLRFVGGGPE